MPAREQNGPSTKKVRGRSQASQDMIAQMHDIAAECQPITGRGIGYKLFSAGIIPTMSITKDANGKKHDPMRPIYRLLKIAREEGIIPWSWIVDETRALERQPTWANPAEYAECVVRSYRRQCWDQQGCRVEVWSEKGTVRGVLAPVLDDYGVGFRVMHGFSSATIVNDIAEDDDGRPLIALYVGDCDPSGMYMSEVDLPKRIEARGGYHVRIFRIAITPDQAEDLPPHDADTKEEDPRHRWFVQSYGSECWELDALDPNTLRNIVRDGIQEWILDRAAWDRVRTVQEAERASIRTAMNAWVRTEPCQ
jgi:hypothetical protein